MTQTKPFFEMKLSLTQFIVLATAAIMVVAVVVSFSIGYSVGASSSGRIVTTTTTQTVKEPVTVTGAILIEPITAMFIIFGLGATIVFSRIMRYES